MFRFALHYLHSIHPAIAPMGSVLSTMRHDASSTVTHARDPAPAQPIRAPTPTRRCEGKNVALMVSFGSDVGLGTIMNKTVPRDDEPHRQCFFKIVEGPLSGRVVSCPRGDITLRDCGDLDMRARICDHCNALHVAAASSSPKPKKCSGCKAVYYCNDTCQKNGWKTHKLQCKK